MLHRIIQKMKVVQIFETRCRHRTAWVSKRGGSSSLYYSRQRGIVIKPRLDCRGYTVVFSLRRTTAAKNCENKTIAVQTNTPFTRWSTHEAEIKQTYSTRRARVLWIRLLARVNGVWVWFNRCSEDLDEHATVCDVSTGTVGPCTDAVTVEFRLRTAGEPPGTSVTGRAVPAAATVVISVRRAKLLTVGRPAWIPQRVARISAVPQWQ